MQKVLSILTVLLLSTGFASAHQLGGGYGFVSGLGHPVLGLDHLLAMISVGILSAQMGKHAIWSVPAAFVGMMLIGGILGMVGVPLISVELGIAMSVFALGIALAMEKKLPGLVAMLAVGAFAIFHGHAHGTEMPVVAQPALYAIGFLVGTAAIHVTGVLIGLSANRSAKGVQLLRFAGAGIAGIGLHLIIL